MTDSQNREFKTQKKRDNSLLICVDRQKMSNFANKIMNMKKWQA